MTLVTKECEHANPVGFVVLTTVPAYACIFCEVKRLESALSSTTSENLRLTRACEEMRAVVEAAKAWRAGKMPVDVDACERLEHAVDALVAAEGKEG